MEIKKNRASASIKRVEGRKIINFVGEVKQELKRVEWTSKDELKSYTKIVVVSTFVFALFIYSVDLIIQGFLGAINILVKFFTG